MLPVWLTDTLTPDLDRALHYTLQWGLEGVVLRVIGRSRVPDVNEEKLRRRLAEAELPAVAVDAGLFEGSPDERAAWMNDVVRLGEVAAFCDRMGCSSLVIGALAGGGTEAAAEPLRRAASVAARHGKTLAARNEGAGRDTGRGLGDLLDAVDEQAVQACWDPATSVQGGEPALEGLEALRGRIGLVIVRDGVPLGDGWERRPVGEGAVGWGAVLNGLHRAGYGGGLCLDVTGLSAKEALREATSLIYLLRDARRS